MGLQTSSSEEPGKLDEREESMGDVFGVNSSLLRCLSRLFSRAPHLELSITLMAEISNESSSSSIVSGHQNAIIQVNKGRVEHLKSLKVITIIIQLTIRNFKSII